MVTKKQSAKSGGVRTIKKYPNRRLYDTQTSAYVTLSDVKDLVLAQEEFKVVDAKTEEDLTRAILLQIILEEEAGGVPLFTTPMLSQMIRFYGHSMQGLVGGYLEKNIQSFIDMQTQFAEQSKQGGVNITPESWAQFMNMQNPMMQNVMGNYVEQSKNLFAQMQEKMKDQANVFSGFPFAPPTKSDK
ncbi:polyhydroxyalkanoate synthesis repressor PhaR [Polynucleobacter sp. MWH-Spelu-300-X4]|jgi:polyhydroxyalkanoate synthesis repressor PhaR|uniref:polyhydroxyalkanoate synthesis repressor PhaR n=1 Tax=Polynucleobacter sp. MWH-Spelu-300-X4 TaxID=2689109 RepID=UPI001BFD7CA7|nr:polyhydroxyalkanoate synthesis repressor PhaR [Polynucleobacter sp. MWH-Spelu-300-X4]QWD78994.1 polyhydroxyalkanoate synthesis repressor PhaR [Polynucleobacter sp. MWH-Spelu-300-X4]